MDPRRSAYRREDIRRMGTIHWQTRFGSPSTGGCGGTGLWKLVVSLQCNVVKFARSKTYSSVSLAHQRALHFATDNQLQVEVICDDKLLVHDQWVA